MINRALLLKLRNLLDEAESDSDLSLLEVMWQVRTHSCNQAEIPQALFRVGEEIASIIYLEDLGMWELQCGGKEYISETFAGAVELLSSQTVVNHCARAEVLPGG